MSRTIRRRNFAKRWLDACRGPTGPTATLLRRRPPAGAVDGRRSQTLGPSESDLVSSYFCGVYNRSGAAQAKPGMLPSRAWCRRTTGSDRSSGSFRRRCWGGTGRDRPGPAALARGSTRDGPGRSSARLPPPSTSHPPPLIDTGCCGEIKYSTSRRAMPRLRPGPTWAVSFSVEGAGWEREALAESSQRARLDRSLDLPTTMKTALVARAAFERQKSAGAAIDSRSGRVSS
jgi:hypothetical protein